MSGMNISGVSSGAYYQNQTMAGQTAGSAQEERKTLAEDLQKEQEEQPTLVDMMREAREKAEAATKKRDELLKRTKSSRRYGDAAIVAYSKLARAKSTGEVDSASGYARRQIAQLRAAKRGDSENADRIQAVINQLQKAVNRAGRKKREISQEKLTAKRQARLEKEKRGREAKRLRQQLKSRQTMRAYREAGYIHEAHTDNRLQDQLHASKLELREQMRELSASTQTSLETAVQQYTAAAISETETAAPEISVQA